MHCANDNILIYRQWTKLTSATVGNEQDWVLNNNIWNRDILVLINVKAHTRMNKSSIHIILQYIFFDSRNLCTDYPWKLILVPLWQIYNHIRIYIHTHIYINQSVGIIGIMEPKIAVQRICFRTNSLFLYFFSGWFVWVPHVLIQFQNWYIQHILHTICLIESFSNIVSYYLNPFQPWEWIMLSFNYHKLNFIIGLYLINSFPIMMC